MTTYKTPIGLDIVGGGAMLFGHGEQAPEIIWRVKKGWPKPVIEVPDQTLEVFTQNSFGKRRMLTIELSSVQVRFDYPEVYEGESPTEPYLLELDMTKDLVVFETTLCF